MDFRSPPDLETRAYVNIHWVHVQITYLVELLLMRSFCVGVMLECWCNTIADRSAVPPAFMDQQRMDYLSIDEDPLK